MCIHVYTYIYMCRYIHVDLFILFLYMCVLCLGDLGPTQVSWRSSLASFPLQSTACINHTVSSSTLFFSFEKHIMEFSRSFKQLISRQDKSDVHVGSAMGHHFNLSNSREIHYFKESSWPVPMGTDGTTSEISWAHQKYPKVLFVALEKGSETLSDEVRGVLVCLGAR